ncbi:MAG: hypothetical protein ACKOBM_15905 [Gammaproteobacteria bacterium]
MSDRWFIRPFQPDDLRAVANLYERLIRSGQSHAPAGLIAAFRALFVDAPVTSADIPCLVIDSAEGIGGFQGVQVRSVSNVGPVASLGPLFVEPALRAQAAGVRLMKAMLDGPQTLSYSDGASEEARRLWERIGGHCSDVLSLEWTIPLQPGATQIDRLRHRAGRALRLTAAALKPLASTIDPLLAGRWRRKLSLAGGRGLSVATLTPDAWIAFAQSIHTGSRFAPDRSPELLRWTLEHMAALTARGRLLCLSIERSGRPLGAMLAYHLPDNTFMIMHADRDIRHGSAVMSAIVGYALDLGCKSMYGRCDGTVQGFLGDYPVMFRRSTPVLVHGHRADLVDRFCGIQSRFSRIDGEWLMNLREQVYA